MPSPLLLASLPRIGSLCASPPSPPPLPKQERRRPETSACIKAVVEDIVKMHKTLQPLLTRHQLHAVFTQARALRAS